MQCIGIGESDFKMLRLKNNYFIDKSMYVNYQLPKGSWLRG